jgi:catechol 2,3-dioxygenase-like lactoylglutathione lyase family enzyme
MSLPILGLHHIARVTNKPAESAKFYCEVLGFRPIKRPNFDFRGAWLLGYGIQIHIIENTQRAEGPSDQIDTRDNHLAFAVSDHAPVKAQLDALGIRYVERVNAGGIPQIFFQDPDGHHVEIGIYPPHPPFLDE